MSVVLSQEAGLASPLGMPILMAVHVPVAFQVKGARALIVKPPTAHLDFGHVQEASCAADESASREGELGDGLETTCMKWGQRMRMWETRQAKPS